MRYYNEKTKRDMRGLGFDEGLQTLFPNSDLWGVYSVVEKDGFTNVEICRLSNATINGATWEHYANVTRTDDDKWEVNTKFNGDGANELWVWGYYSSFGRAIRAIANGTFNKKKQPIKKF